MHHNIYTCIWSQYQSGHSKHRTPTRKLRVYSTSSLTRLWCRILTLTGCSAPVGPIKLRGLVRSRKEVVQVLPRLWEGTTGKFDPLRRQERRDSLVLTGLTYRNEGGLNKWHGLRCPRSPLLIVRRPRVRIPTLEWISRKKIRALNALVDLVPVESGTDQMVYCYDSRSR